MKLALVAILAASVCGLVPPEDPRAATDAPSEVVRLRAELESARAREESLQREIERLRGELRRMQDDRLAREREWLRYTQGVAKLETLAGTPRFEVDARASAAAPRADADPPSTPRADAAPPAATAGATASSDPAARAASTLGAAPAPSASASAPSTASATADAPRERSDSAARAAAARAAERNRGVFLALRSLFAVEEISGFDLLESGSLADGATGPVVLRLLDDRGRPLGSLYAERLRFEASLAARTLTLVLERGWERRGGTKTPFDGAEPDEQGRGGVRRIELAHVDPKPWMDALPELFPERATIETVDDGKHDLVALRVALDRLMKADVGAGAYALAAVGGVQGRVLRDVRIEALDRAGRVEKELFADRMSVRPLEHGLVIELESGSQMKDGAKIAFLDGRYRIFLPRARADAWREAGVPIVEPDR